MLGKMMRILVVRDSVVKYLDQYSPWRCCLFVNVAVHSGIRIKDFFVFSDLLTSWLVSMFFTHKREREETVCSVVCCTNIAKSLTLLSKAIPKLHFFLPLFLAGRASWATHMNDNHGNSVMSGVDLYFPRGPSIAPAIVLNEHCFHANLPRH